METVHEFIAVNDSRQSIMTMRTDPRNPVLLIVHGGAGFPDRPPLAEFSRELA